MNPIHVLEYDQTTNVQGSMERIVPLSRIKLELIQESPFKDAGRVVAFEYHRLG